MNRQGNSSDMLTQIGEKFGDAVAQLVRTVRAYAVTVSRIDTEQNVAYVTFYSDEAEFPISMSLLGYGMVTAVPNVGSLAVISFMNGDDTTPFFVAYEAVDSLIFKRGKTEIRWNITPPERDDEGNEIEAETDDEISIVVDTSSIRIVKDLIEINGGSLGDLVVIGKLTERLNKLQSEIDDIQSNIASHTHTVSTTGSAAAQTGQTTGTTYTRKQLTQVENTDYNNEKITQ